MKKALKIILKLISSIIIFVIMLPIVISIVLQLSFVQNLVVDKASEVLSNVAKTKVSIGHVALDFFTSARLEDVYMEDYSGDTMIYVKNIKVAIRGINFITGKITLGATTLTDGQINLYKDSLGMMNVTEVFENFKPAVPNENPPNFRLTADELNLLNIRFSMSEYNVPKSSSGINYKDMDIRDIDFQARNISVFNHSIWLSLEHLSFDEKSGFRLQHLSSNKCGVDSSGMYYADVVVESDKTLLRLDSLNFLTENQSWWDWDDFENKMILSAKVRNSIISTQTLGYFTGFKLPKTELLSLYSAELRGPVPDMRGKINNVNLLGNSLWADFSIRGVTDIDNALFGLNISKLTTSASAIDRAIQLFGVPELESEVYNVIYNLGDIELVANVNGSLDKLTSSYSIKSSVSGMFRGEAIVHIGDDNHLKISGSLSTTDFNAGQTLGVAKMGLLSLGGDYELNIFQNSPMLLDANFNIAKFDYGAYRFNGIVLDGEFRSKMFNGLISSDDPNFDFEVVGLLDFSSKTPQYRVDVDLRNANLYELGVNRRDSISLLSAQFTANCSGSTLDDFNGFGTIDKILYINHIDTIKTDAINIYSIAKPQYKELDIKSHFADIRLRGRNSFSEIGRYLSQSIERFLPSFEDASTIVKQEWSSDSKGKKLPKASTDFPFSDGYYQLTVKVKEANNVASIFVPSLQIASESMLNFFFNPYLDQVTLRARSKYITSDSFLVENLSIDSQNHSDSLSLFTTASLLAIKDIKLPNFSLLGGVRDNVITLGAQFKDKDERNSVLLQTTTSFVRANNGIPPKMIIDIHPTAIVIDSQMWSVTPSEIVLDTTAININNLSLYSDNERYSLTGQLGSKKSDTLTLKLQNADISPVSMFISDLGYEMSGYASGEVRTIAPLGEIELFAIVDFKDIDLSGTKLGSPQLRSTIDNAGKQINFTLGNDLRNPPFVGFYNIPNREFGVDMVLDSVPMKLLDPMLSGILVDGSGNAKADLKLRGSLDDVSLDGKIEVDNYSTTLDYTRTRYNIPKAEIAVKNSCFYLPNTPIIAFNVGTGDIRASLTTNSFKDLQYNIDVWITDFHALNTTAKDNSNFYGTAYGTGHVEVKGNERNTSVVITAQSALNSDIIMPLSGASTIEAVDYIKFVSEKKDTTSTLNSVHQRYFDRLNKGNVNSSSNDLDLRLNLTISPNLLAQIELDAKVGDIIKGRGEGRLMMHINPKMNLFTMNGPIEITQGNYLFTLKTIVNKRFIIDPGSQLLWTGDPTNPEVNLTAIYKLKTSLTPLTGTIGGNSSANIDCGIKLTGQLMTPVINFSITAPSADTEIQSYIRNAINTQEALSMQFISLMLANSFMPDMGTAAIGSIGTNMASVTGIEFLSNQLSNLLSNDRFNLRLNYKPYSVTSSDEVTAGFGADLIEDVLTLEVDGNYNARNNSVIKNQNPFSVDAYLTCNINKRGTLNLKGFTRTIDRFDETQGLQEGGFGIYFRQDFKNLKDLKKRLKNSFSRDTLLLAKKRAER